MVNMGLTIAERISAGVVKDSACKHNSLSSNKTGDTVFSFGMFVLRGGLIAIIASVAVYVMMCLAGGLMNLNAAPDIWTVAQSMFSSIYDSIKGIAAWAAIAGAVFCLLGIFFQRDEKAVAGKLKALIIIGLAYVGIFVLPNLIATLTGIMNGAGVSDVTGLD